MYDQTITCPSCGRNISVSQTLTKQLTNAIQEHVEEEYLKKQQKWQDQEKSKLWIVAQKKAEEKFAIELKDREQALKDQKERIDKLQEQELELRRERRALEEEKSKITLEVERKVDEVKKRVIEQVHKESNEAYRQKILEKDKQMDMMKKTIEELRRKSEQGSMQIQGEVREESLKSLLIHQFPQDLIEDVAVGIRGADLIQRVVNNSGQKVGVILWESKQTKTFSSEWIKKLKNDQSRAKADVCVLVSNILPEGVANFGLYEGVWVTAHEFITTLTYALRYHLIHSFTLKQSLVGSGKKMELLYNYLLSSDFRNKIETIISTFTSQKSDLESEKRAMARIWSKREKEIEKVIASTSSFYGDLQGVIGHSLPTIPTLGLEE